MEKGTLGLTQNIEKDPKRNIYKGQKYRYCIDEKMAQKQTPRNAIKSQITNGEVVGLPLSYSKTSALQEGDKKTLGKDQEEKTKMEDEFENNEPSFYDLAEQNGTLIYYQIDSEGNKLTAEDY